MLRISEATSLALHAMAFLAANPDHLIPAKRIATALHISTHHLAKVLQRLARLGLLRSTRGPDGGFRLAKEADSITLLEVYEAIDGPLTPGRCLFLAPSCRGDKCILGGLVEGVNAQFREYLGRTKLSELTDVAWRNNADATKDHTD